ncbi:amino acid permease/ SLC12A domain-containing protein [Aspergillus undulatus]|uniref:Transporter n=1 Tax=Emericella variicolor TaxID=1549217 RepID=A0A6J3ZW05_EMEVA|nr:transporter [Aspergillus stellatus]
MSPPQDTDIQGKEPEKTTKDNNAAPSLLADMPGSVAEHGTEHNGLHRQLENRQIQLIAIGGSIGTALFVSIGEGLSQGGPGSLLIAYSIYCVMLSLVNNCIAEMTIYMPLSGSFIRLAGKWVDEAFGFMAGWNFYFYEALLVPFEITALNLVLSFWRDDIPIAAVSVACIVLYALLNILAVKAYGESEFWLSSGKVVLILILFFFTFVTMVGGNPQSDTYGFRYWNDPGSFATHSSSGSLGRFEGFLAALWSACFTCVGPEYVSVVAAEAKFPRTYIKTAFKTVYYRFIVFFIGGALCSGIVVAYNDPTLVQAVTGEGSGTAAASPYVIAMRNLEIQALPHLINALLVTTIFSAGNTYTYCATRTLYGLALDGRAPRIFTKCTKQGVPIYCFAVTMLIACLSFLQLSSNSSQVLSWLINLTTAAGIIDYIVMCVTYIWFYRACIAQGFDRSTLPYTGYFQPWCGYIGLVWMVLVVTCYGYESFTPWDVTSFFTHYTMIIVGAVLYTGWKLLKKTRLLRPHELDLYWEAPQITAYEEALSLREPVTTFWGEVFSFLRRDKGRNVPGEAVSA